MRFKGGHAGKNGLGLAVEIRASVYGGSGVSQVAFGDAAILVMAGGIGQVAIEFVVRQQACAANGAGCGEFRTFPVGL